MLMGEVATLVKYNMNVKVIIIKNNVLGQIKWEQIVLEGNPEFGIESAAHRFRGLCDELRRGGIHYRAARRCGMRASRSVGASGAGGRSRPSSIRMNRRCPGRSQRNRRSSSRKRCLKGQKEGGKILKTMIEDKFREVV